jgi:uncharacterized membrane protein YdjX (TVP38/TMEM64 family)/rhodanese-related sulfurtransferase
MSARVLRIVIALAVAGAAIWLALHRDQLDTTLVEAAIRNAGWWAPVAHIALFATGTVLFVPGAIFALAGGALFGPSWGTVLNVMGAMTGATAAFVIARHLGAEWVRQKAGRKLQRVIAGVEAEGWRFVALVRLIPLFPFNLTNYALGLTHIPLTQYVLASLVCMLPGALAYTWLGYAGRQALEGDQTAIRYGLLALAILALVAFLPRLIHRFRDGARTRWLDVRDLPAKLRQHDTVVLDVRSPEEFVGPLGHLAEAINLPVGDLPGRLNEVNALKDRPVVVICRTDKRSGRAAAILSDEGFRNVHVLRGGMEAWNRNGLPVEGQAV